MTAYYFRIKILVIIHIEIPITVVFDDAVHAVLLELSLGYPDLRTSLSSIAVVEVTHRLPGADDRVVGDADCHLQGLVCEVALHFFLEALAEA